MEIGRDTGNRLTWVNDWNGCATTGRNTIALISRDAAHRIASGLRFGSLGDSNGRVGDYYVVTAQNAYGESGPSNTAQAMADCGWNCWYASGQFGPAGARRGYVTRSAGARPLAKPALQTTLPLSVTVITYAYDPLYRLTNASYTGSVTASYNYVYDAVGNMTAYTETVGANTTSVNRTFNAANQLVTATDATSGTTSYYYDANGNLTRILPPGVNAGEAGEQQYSYNQRNLLLTVATGAGGGVYTPNASYAYDGDGNRVQQTDYSGSQPVTTIYTNDNLGLSQALIADNGTTQTANLYGLDLILQDDGAQTRTLLTDGLGSVRQEMAGSVLETATTYEPYGNILAQTGSSGTVYGFTGEQFDGATNLLYLRARYYNPGLKLFMSRDPFPGWLGLPASQHGYTYAHNNPVLLTDPSGEIVPLIVGGIIIGAVTGVTWDVMVVQGAGGIDNVLSGALWDNLRCRVDWERAGLSGGLGGLIGGTAAPVIAAVPSAAGAVYNSVPSAYAQWLYYSGFKYPWLGKTVALGGTAVGLSDTISDNILRIRAMMGDPYAQAAMAEAMATWNPTLALKGGLDVDDEFNLRREITDRYAEYRCFYCAKELHETFGDDIVLITSGTYRKELVGPGGYGPGYTDIGAPDGWHVGTVDRQGDFWDNGGYQGNAVEYLSVFSEVNQNVTQKWFDNIGDLEREIINFKRGESWWLRRNK